MPFTPDPDTVQRIAWIVSGLGFLVAAVGVAGELLGWWNDIGELAITIGTIVGAFAGIGGLFHGSSRTQVSEVGERVEGVRETIEGNGAKLGDVHEAIVGEDGMVGELDVIETELDKQTGVLEEQLTVLGKIHEGTE